jgi:UDP:flavonoid glycosyltransferase YjiC (YdhE family)
MPEQAATADRVAELGLGVRLEPESAQRDALRQAVEAAAAASYRTRLTEMQERRCG